MCQKIFPQIGLKIRAGAGFSSESATGPFPKYVRWNNLGTQDNSVMKNI